MDLFDRFFGVTCPLPAIPAFHTNTNGAPTNQNAASFLYPAPLRYIGAGLLWTLFDMRGDNQNLAPIFELGSG
ncbi:MAG: hypothetical protein HY650_07820 [Acidobacteria bacterium]|nr:hypothetical protein [Acidobacteriota bacterium]